VFGCIDRENDLGTQGGDGLDSAGPNRKIARVRLTSRLNANAKASNSRIVPKVSLWFGKGFNQTTERSNSGVRSPSVFGNFKVCTILPAVTSDVEGYHLRAEALYERLKITLRIDIQINVQKMCGWQ
jgi:hypothetical protein